MIKITSLQPLLDAFDVQDTRWATALSIYLSKDRTLIHRYLKDLVQRGMLTIVWSWPHTSYQKIWWSVRSVNIPNYDFWYADVQILDAFFYKFAPNGEILSGKDGFVRRCILRNMDPQQKIKSFVSLARNIQNSKNQCWLIDVTADFAERIPWSGIDVLMYADQYTWLEFGRGKLAELTFYAKDNQSRKLIDQSISMVKNQLECLIRQYDIQAIAFTPHSKKRSIQLLHELKKKLNTYGLPLIKLVKYAPYGTVISQKSLKTREQRIQNAQQTILVDAQKLDYQRVLLIDDFVGSGATLNETAKKLKNLWVQTVIWFARVWNTNLRYDVINEI